jgi:hypothetical protein
MCARVAVASPCVQTAIAVIVYKAVTQRKAPDYDVEKHYWNPKSATGCVGSIMLILVRRNTRVIVGCVRVTL